MTPILSTTIWLQLKETTKMALRDAFSIPQSGGREVMNNRIVSDGTTPENLKAITLEKLQEHTNSKSTDFYKLFELTVNGIENPEVKKEVIKKKTNAKKSKKSK